MSVRGNNTISADEDAGAVGRIILDEISFGAGGTDKHIVENEHIGGIPGVNAPSVRQVPLLRPRRENGVAAEYDVPGIGGIEGQAGRIFEAIPLNQDVGQDRIGAVQRVPAVLTADPEVPDPASC